MYDLMSVIKETHVENKKISISPQTYVDYNFRIDYNSKNEGYSYRLYVIEVIYERFHFVLISVFVNILCQNFHLHI